MRKLLVVALILAGFFGAMAASSAEGYNYITADNLYDRIKAGSPMIILDICPAALFAQGYIKGSIETNAYPVKSEQEKQRLAKHLPTLQTSTEDIIIVCPRGGGGAKNTVDFYAAKGIAADRLLILEKGILKWPYETEAR